MELARALGRIPSVARVDLLTRLVADPSVHSSYSVPEESLLTPTDGTVSHPDDGGEDVSKGDGVQGAFIVRLPCGPSSVYLR